MSNLYKLFITYLFISECGRQAGEMLDTDNWIIILIYQIVVCGGFICVAKYLTNLQKTK